TASSADDPAMSTARSPGCQPSKCRPMPLRPARAFAPLTEVRADREDSNGARAPPDGIVEAPSYPSEELPVAENRKHPTKDDEAPVGSRVRGGQLVEATCRDVSLGGMFIDTPSPEPYGTAVEVFIRLPGLPSDTQIATVVRWSKPTGMGVQ